MKTINIYFGVVFVENLEFHDQYDQFVGSVEESDCLSPTDAQQWMYDRARGQSSISEFISNNDDILEDDEASYDNTNRRESEVIKELNIYNNLKLIKFILNS